MSNTSTFQLDEEEYDTLLLQDPETKSNGGFQSLIVQLQESTDESTRIITIPDKLLPKIPQYAFDYKNGGWENRLIKIFSRHLGPRLGR